MADFARFSLAVEKRSDSRVVSITVKPTVRNCTGKVWFTDLCLQEGAVLTGYHPNTEIFLKKLRENGSIKPPVWFNGVVRSKATVVLFNCGTTSAPLDVHICPTADMEAGSIALCQGAGGQKALFPNAIEKDADLALLAESRSCTKDGEPEPKEGFYQYSAAWDSKHTVTLEDRKSARVLFSMQELEGYLMPKLVGEIEPEPGPEPEPEIKEEFISVIRLNASFQYTTTVHYFTNVADAAAMVSDSSDFQYAIVIGEKSGVTEIAPYAFDHIANLCELQIPNTVSKIGGYACNFCTNLRKMRMPNNQQFTSLPEGICNYCEHLESVNIPDYVCDIEAYAFNESGISGIKFSDKVRSVGNLAFCNCRNLTEIILPDSMKSTGTYAFAGCANVKKLELNEGLQVISANAYSGLAITSVVIPSTVQAILERAFLNCRSLQEATLQPGISFIGASAFETTELQTITIPKTVTAIGENAFKIAGGIAITVQKPTGSITGAPWGDSTNTVIWQE